jgi:hypothetical protein
MRDPARENLLKYSFLTISLFTKASGINSCGTVMDLHHDYLFFILINCFI